jgi:hypothetical protein
MISRREHNTISKNYIAINHDTTILCNPTLQAMKERDLCIRETKKTILAKMVKISSHAKYAEFIRLCIIEVCM